MNNISLFDNINLEGEKFILVGVSTGPDSMCLLHLLQIYSHLPIICIHINHNVRKQSLKEYNFLKNYCYNNNIMFESMKIDNYTKNNFENEAREKRYAFYEEMLKKYNSHYLFLAHHADDLIETILMKIVRGSNLEGYAGFKKISKVKNYYIVRPLIEYTKDDILKYNKNNSIKYYIDKSNKDTKYTRNRYRKYMLPLLKKEDPLVHKKFIKYSKTLLEYNNYIKNMISNITKEIYIDNYLDITKYNTYDEFTKKNIIYDILNSLYNDKSNIIKEKNVLDILKIIANDKPNLSIDLPLNYYGVKAYNKLYFNTYLNVDKDYKFLFKDKFEMYNHLITKIDDTFDNGNDICRLNSKSIKLPLYIRNKKNSDYMEVLGLNGKKKVKDVFINSKIPLIERNVYPILIDSDDNIIWIPNIKKSKFCSKKNESYDIILRYTKKGGNYE